VTARPARALEVPGYDAATGSPDHEESDAMAVIAELSGGDIALIILSAFWGLLVLFLCVVLINTFRVLESTKMTIDSMREETVPLLREVKVSIERTNGLLEQANTVAGRVDKISSLVEQAAAGPLTKVVSFGAGLQKAAKRFRGERSSAR
jgi:uncharacterized protein YoxC